MVFPQSGGENKGGRFTKGKAKIMYIAARKMRLNLRLNFILVYNIPKKYQKKVDEPY
jgi:hypothetical protein